MKVLCDTCCVLLVVRIAPNMFIDEKYECFTIHEVRNEIFRKQRFKSKYPWRGDFKAQIKVKSFKPEIKEQYDFHFDVINKMIESCTLNKRINRCFDLSYTDQKIVAYALASNSLVSTNEKNMRDFLEQEFNEKSISSLALINRWIKDGLIIWNSHLHGIIEDWERNDEPVQPAEDIIEFVALAGHEYVGP